MVLLLVVFVLSKTLHRKSYATGRFTNFPKEPSASVKPVINQGYHRVIFSRQLIEHRGMDMRADQLYESRDRSTTNIKSIWVTSSHFLLCSIKTQFSRQGLNEKLYFSLAEA